MKDHRQKAVRQAKAADKQAPQADRKAEQDEQFVNALLLAEDAVQTTAYAMSAPSCCSPTEQLDNMLSMLGADIEDDTVYHDEKEHQNLSM